MSTPKSDALLKDTVTASNNPTQHGCQTKHDVTCGISSKSSLHVFFDGRMKYNVDEAKMGKMLGFRPVI